MEIYLAKNEQKHGPYTAAEVRARIASGSFTGDDLGWYQGLTEWQPLEKLLASFPDEPGSSPVRRASSGFAKTSFLIAAFGVVVWLVLIVAAAVGVMRGVGDASFLMLGLGLAMFLTAGANLVGIIFGVIALPKRISNKWMAIVGLTGNSLELLGVLFLFLLGLARK